MKYFMIMLIVLVPLILLGQTFNSVDITFTFDNGQITTDGTDQFYEFDIMIN